MKTIDRYVARGFLFAYFVVLVAFLGLAVAIDASINLDEFMELVPGGESALTRARHLLAIMGNWYAVQVPFFFQMLMPIITVVAAVVTVVTLKRRNELVPLLASGVSVYRALWPIMALALLASGLGLANQEVLLPRLAYRLVRRPDDPHGLRPQRISTGFFTDADGNLISATEFVPASQILRMVHVDGSRSKSGRVHTIFAEEGRWGEAPGVLRLTRGWIQRIGPDGALLPRQAFGPDEALPCYDFETSLQPSDIDRPTRWARLSTSADLIARLRLRPDKDRLRVELHSRYVIPLHAVILLMLGLPLVLMQESKSVIVGLGIALVICLAYLGVQFVAEQMGASGRVAPILAVWLPIFIFGPVAILLFDGIRT